MKVVISFTTLQANKTSSILPASVLPLQMIFHRFVEREKYTHLRLMWMRRCSGEVLEIIKLDN